MQYQGGFQAMEEVSDTNFIISTVISRVLGSSLFAEEVEE